MWLKWMHIVFYLVGLLCFVNYNLFFNIHNSSGEAYKIIKSCILVMPLDKKLLKKR